MAQETLRSAQSKVLEHHYKDSTAKIQYLIDWIQENYGLHDGFTFPDGETWWPTPIKTNTIQETINRQENKLDSYYYRFEPTGVDSIDTILGAVALAGSWAHHTQDWTDDHYRRTYGFTPIEAIQQVAEEAANSVLEMEQEISDIETEVTKVYDNLTGGKISKPSTIASIVISAHNEHCWGEYEL